MKSLFAIFIFALLSSSVASQTNDPTPAPKNTLLVLGTCRAVWFKGGYAARGKGYDWNNNPAFKPNTCPDFNAEEILVPGEYRTFVHVIGPTQEYTLSCLGKVSYSGWAGHYNASKDCAFPDYGGRNMVSGSNPLEWGRVAFALPEVGTYVPALWNKDKTELTIRFRRDYKDTKGIEFAFSVVRTTTTQFSDPSSGIPAANVYLSERGTGREWFAEVQAGRVESLRL